MLKKIMDRIADAEAEEEEFEKADKAINPKGVVAGGEGMNVGGGDRKGAARPCDYFDLIGELGP